MLWLVLARVALPRPVADDGIQHLNDPAPTPRAFVFDRSARGDGTLRCPKCGKSPDGKSNCCSEGGTWQGQCTLTLADGSQHTVDGCNRAMTVSCTSSPGRGELRGLVQPLTVLAPEAPVPKVPTSPRAPAGRGVAAAPTAPVPEKRLEIQVRKCDSEREEWCDGAQIESALPPGGDPRHCTTFPDAHLPDSWCAELRLPVPNCPKKMRLLQGGRFLPIERGGR